MSTKKPPKAKLYLLQIEGWAFLNNCPLLEKLSLLLTLFLDVNYWFFRLCCLNGSTVLHSLKQLTNFIPFLHRQRKKISERLKTCTEWSSKFKRFFGLSNFKLSEQFFVSFCIFHVFYRHKFELSFRASCTSSYVLVAHSC